MTSVVECLERLGGVASSSSLLASVDRRALDRALAAGDVVQDARGRYALPTADTDVRAAARLGGVVGLTSTALRHGWAVRQVPTRPQVVVSRGRRLRGDPGADVHFAELGPGDTDGLVTSQETTLRHCLTRLPLADALAVADSALREGADPGLLRHLHDVARGRGAARLRRVVDLAGAAKANPFESATHAICVGVPGLQVRPQVILAELGFRVDFVDERLRLVVEADSFEWHGRRSALASDCRRYNAMVCRQWLVLRFPYEDVMHEPREVHRTLADAVACAELLKNMMSGAR